MQSRNEAYLAKLCWRLANEQEASWARVLMRKCFTNLRITEAVAGKVQAEKYIQAISWQKPPVGWAKLNTDGSSCDCVGGWRNTEE
nr:hypothetical protein CFP56_59198 [Quercus suber]